MDISTFLSPKEAKLLKSLGLDMSLKTPNQDKGDNEQITFADFCELAGYPRPFDKQLEMIEHCYQDGINLLLASRGYGKTDYIVIMRTCYELYNNPLKTFLIITKEQERGKAFIRSMKHIFNTLMVSFNGDTTSINLTGNTNKDESVKALSVNSAGLRGRHPYKIILDDVITPASQSPADRKQVEILYSELPKLSPNITLIGQPVHKLDIYSILRISPEVQVMEVWYGQIPELDVMHDLDKQRQQGVSETSIQANYFGILTGEDFMPFKDMEVIPYNVEVLEEVTRYSYLDPSYGHDYTALCMGGIHHRFGKIYVYGRAWKKPYHKLLDDIAIIANISKDFVYESNGVGSVLRDMLRNHQTPANAQMLNNTKNKHLRIMKYEALVDDIILLDDGSDECSAFISQVLNYELKVEHDDAPDALAGLLGQVVPRR